MHSLGKVSGVGQCVGGVRKESVSCVCGIEEGQRDRDWEGEGGRNG